MLGEEAGVASVTLGLGTALVYPTLLASVSDGAAPSWRDSSSPGECRKLESDDQLRRAGLGAAA